MIAAILTTLAGLIVMTSAGIDGVIFGPWGVVLTVMTLYTLYYPRQEILFLFFIPMPIWVLAVDLHRAPGAGPVRA